MRFTAIQFRTPDLHLLQEFYGQILGLPVRCTDQQLEVTIGYTRLSFLPGAAVPPYHFAINIPANKGPEALEWLKSRVSILPFLGNELVPFTAWNAEAMYFLDPAQNIVELIARKNLPNASEAPFSTSQWLGISEIGTPVSTIQPFYDWLHRETGMKVYSGEMDRFCAIGDEEALFIAVDRYRKKWIPVDCTAEPAPFRVTLETETNQYQLAFSDERFQHI
jgi:catechol 2,3-dioxygenase-like lactoylglutathione lyase family enzyme